MNQVHSLAQVHEMLFNLTTFVQNFSSMNTIKPVSPGKAPYEIIPTFVHSQLYIEGGAQFNAVLHHQINNDDEQYEYYEERYCDAVIELNKHILYAVPNNDEFKLILGDPGNYQCCIIIWHNPWTNDVISINHSHFTSSINIHISNNYSI